MKCIQVRFCNKPAATNGGRQRCMRTVFLNGPTLQRTPTVCSLEDGPSGLQQAPAAPCVHLKEQDPAPTQCQLIPKSAKGQQVNSGY